LKMMSAKSPLECCLSLILQCKEVIPAASRVTVFVVDMHLQYYIATKTKSKANTRDIPCEGIQNGTIMGVFDKEEEFCAPFFSEIQEGMKPFNTQRLISVPYKNEQDQLMFTMQIECDAVIDAVTNVLQKKLTSHMSKNKQSLQLNFGRQQLGHGNPINKQDYNLLQLASLFGASRFEVFINNMVLEKKDQVILNTIDFVKNFVRFTNLKEILYSVKYDIPKLLGFSAANIYILDPSGDSLFALQIDEDAEKRAKESKSYSFANEYAFDESQIVRFPLSMGVNGFSFATNSVNYFN